MASIVGLMPTQLILCYIGSTLKSMSDVLSNDSTARTASFVFIVQLIIAIAAMYYILNAAKKELDKHIIGDNASSVTSSSSSSICKSLPVNLGVDCDGKMQKCSFCSSDLRISSTNSAFACESCKLLSSSSSSSVIQMT